MILRYQAAGYTEGEGILMANKLLSGVAQGGVKIERL